MYKIKFVLKTLLIIIVVSIITGYAYYRTKDFTHGPIVTITSPINGASVDESLIEIVGVANSISYISLNDRQIFTDEKGNFKEKLLLYSGYNIISIKANDRFERNIEKTLEIIYIEPKQDLEARLPDDNTNELLN